MRVRDILALSTASALACGGTPSPPPSTIVEPPAPALTAGWLGMAAVPEGRTQPLTPLTDQAQVVVPGAFPAEPGAPFSAWTTAGRVELTFTGMAQVPYGCDDIPTEMALFSAAAPLPEGLVWITEPGVDPSLHPTTLTDAATPMLARWSGGGLELEARLEQPLSGVLEVRRGEVLGTVPFSVQPMAGDSDPTPDLTEPHPIGVPIPVLLMGTTPKRLVTRRYSYEGVHFDTWQITDRVEPEASSYLYLCAF